jgi:mannose-6-phosphate isomerase-like protein (cupin superfamily)
MPATSQQLHNAASSAGAGRLEHILGVSHIYKATAEETGGSFVCLELTVPAGHGIPTHLHTREDESFYVVEGTVLIHGDDVPDGKPMGPGAFFYGPRGRRHTFHNPGPETAKLLVVAIPGANLEAMFGELAVLTKQGPTPEKVSELCARFGIHFDPPPAGS